MWPAGQAGALTCRFRCSAGCQGEPTFSARVSGLFSRFLTTCAETTRALRTLPGGTLSNQQSQAALIMDCGHRLAQQVALDARVTFRRSSMAPYLSLRLPYFLMSSTALIGA